MYISQFALVAALAASVSAHGVVTEIQGANGVNMPGLTVADGTPRDCSSKYVALTSYPWNYTDSPQRMRFSGRHRYHP